MASFVTTTQHSTGRGRRARSTTLDTGFGSTWARGALAVVFGWTCVPERKSSVYSAESRDGGTGRARESERYRSSKGVAGKMCQSISLACVLHQNTGDVTRLHILAFTVASARHKVEFTLTWHSSAQTLDIDQHACSHQVGTLALADDAMDDLTSVHL